MFCLLPGMALGYGLGSGASAIFILRLRLKESQLLQEVLPVNCQRFVDEANISGTVKPQIVPHP